jgi:hydroxyacylglutathione hydrolase
MEIHTVPLFSDNYAYILVDAASREAAVVDPAEPQKVLDAVAAVPGGCKLTTVLCTHNHWDHAGGNEELARRVEGLAVIGGRGDGAAGVTREVGEADSGDVRVGGLSLRVIETPCHTVGHVCFFVEAGGRRAVFTGDTMFVGGCGNFNTGTPAMMHEAFRKLVALPGDTEAFVGHEYTVKNLQFAAVVEPASEAVAARLAWAIGKREAGEPTSPSTIADEMATNPFVRVAEPAVRAWAGTQDDVATMKRVREGKSDGGSWYTPQHKAADPDARL